MGIAIRCAWIVVASAAFLCPLAVSAAGHALLESHEDGSREFIEVEIADKMIVYFHQRMLGEAIVDKDHVVYQFDINTKELLAKRENWRDDLPEALPDLRMSSDEAASLVSGKIRSVELYIISPESYVFPLDPTPTNPCWIVTSIDGGRLVLTVVDAIDGVVLGNGVPPPYDAFSLTGPWYFEPCDGAWSAWSGNAETWFETMGYSTEEIIWPTENQVKNHVQSIATALFYELAHGGSTSFSSGCIGGQTGESTTAAEIEQWIVNYGRMPFAFIGSCGGMCSTGDGSFAYEFRKGAPDRTVTVGYCGMAEEYCSTCWNYSIEWQTALFNHMSQGWTIKDAFDQANANYPMCANSDCMRFQGDETFAVVPKIERQEAAWLDVTIGPEGDAGKGTGLAWGDYDNDGDLDIYLSNWGEPNKLFRNEGGGVFVDATSVVLGDSSESYGVAWGDYDNDGDLDLYLANDGPNKLFRNDGGGTFVDVTSGPLANDEDGQGVGWADYDNDGDLDLYVASVGPNVLLRNEGPPDWEFVDATAPPLDDGGQGYGIAWADCDNDGDQDLYLVNRSAANKLFRNDGDGVFADATAGPLGDTGAGSGVIWGDYDNDGDLDLYLTKLFGENKLLRNDGGMFTDVSVGALADPNDGTGAAWGDYDNDGDLDLYIVNYYRSNKLLRNESAPDPLFVDRTIAPLDNDDGGRGVAFGDHDNDGDIDIYLANWGQANKLFRNGDAGGNNWLHVNLKGTVSNASAIGARVRVVAGGVSQIREVSGGSGYLSQNSLTAEFGLGVAAVVDTVVVKWPSGIVQRVTGLVANQFSLIVEDDSGTGVVTTYEPEPSYVLHGNFPNPFKPSTQISYQLPEPARIRIDIYNISGRLVRTLLDDTMRGAGAHEIAWDGRDDIGHGAAAGVYYYRLEVNGQALSKQMVLLK